jgi:hypothetical protein
VAAGAALKRDENMARGQKIRPSVGGNALLKGAGGTRTEGGSEESGDAWAEWGERGGDQARHGAVQRRGVGR